MNDETNIVLHGEFFAPVPVDTKIWGGLILDLLLNSDSEENIAEAYNLDLPALEALKQHAPFREEFEKVKTYVESLGPDGGFKLRARAIAENAILTMATIINDSNVHPSVRAGLFRDMVRYADLDPATTAKGKEETNVKRGPLVQINMGGLMSLSARPIIDVKSE